MAKQTKKMRVVQGVQPQIQGAPGMQPPLINAGNGDLDYTCGKCDFLLVRGASPGQINIVLGCPCGAINSPN